MLNEEKGSLEEFVGFELITENLKKIITIDPKLRKDLSVFLETNIGVPHLVSVKRCNVEYIDYDGIDMDDLDVEESKDMYFKIKKNNRQCPIHRSCPLFISNNLQCGEKCMVELLDAQYMVDGFRRELEINDEEDFNDQILLGQMVGLQLINNRAFREMSCSPLIEEVKTVGKDGTKYDTKKHEAYGILESSTKLLRQLKEDLILNRKDKATFKKVKQAKTMADVTEKINDHIKHKESTFNIEEAIMADSKQVGVSDFGDI